MAEPPTYENEHEQPVTDHIDSHDDFDPEEEPVGTLALLTVYLIVIIGLWVAVYVTLIQRS